MPTPASDAYEAWNIADLRARSAESKLAQAWQEYFEGKGSAPHDDLFREVAHLRAVANEKLTLAMVAIGVAARRTGDHPGQLSSRTTKA